MTIISDKDRVIIFDTTLRDGEQSPGASMTLEEKLEVADLLDAMGVDIIEAGFPIASNGDFEAVSEIAKRIKRATVAGLARAINADIDRAGEAVRGAFGGRGGAVAGLEADDQGKRLRAMLAEESDRVVRGDIVDPTLRRGGFAVDLDRAVHVAALADKAGRVVEAGARAALARLADAGIPLMGQTVLLRGINDDVETLDQLMRALVTARVKPYYLHHPDLVRGTGHFRVSIEAGQALMKALRGRLSGLAQPTYVLDVPGGHGKVPIGPAYLGDDPSALAVEDAFGGQHRYPG